MKHYRRYKNTKIETLCQMVVVKPPKPTELTEFQKLLFRGMANSPQGMYCYAPQQQAQSDWLSSLFGGMGGNGIGPN